MEKRMRTNLALAAVVGLLAMVIWLAPSPDDDEQQGISLFDGKAFNRIEVREHGEPRLVLERRDDGWQLIEPYRLHADEYQVNSLVASLRKPAERSYSLADVDPAQLELDEPRWTVHVDGEEVAIGGLSAVGSSRYIRKGDQVYLVGDVLTYRLQRDPLDYASKRLLPENADIAAISLPAGQRVINTGAGWQLEPGNDAVSADDVQRLVSAWESASSIGVSAAEESAEGDAAIIELADGTELVFSADFDENNFALQRNEPPVRYEMVREDARRLLQLEVAMQTEGGE